MKQVFKGIFTKNSKSEVLNYCGIYKIINLVTNKFYIGSTSTSFYKRWSQHSNQLRKNKHANMYLQNSWNKHGVSSFEFKILEIIDNNSLPEDFIKSEQEWLDQEECVYPNGYNISPFAGRPPEMTKEQKLKLMNIWKEKSKVNMDNSLSLNEQQIIRIKELFITGKCSIEDLTYTYNINRIMLEEILCDKNLKLFNLSDKRLEEIYENYKNKTLRRKTSVRSSDNCQCDSCIYCEKENEYCFMFDRFLYFTIDDCNHYIMITDDDDRNYLWKLYQGENIDEIMERYYQGKLI